MNKNVKCLKAEWEVKLCSTIAWCKKKKEKLSIHLSSRVMPMKNNTGMTKRNALKLFLLSNLPWQHLLKVKMKLLLEIFLHANSKSITITLTKGKRVDTFIQNIIHTLREITGSSLLLTKPSQDSLLSRSLLSLIILILKSSRKEFKDQVKFHSHQSWPTIHTKD